MSERQSLPGNMRDWRTYAVATAFTSSFVLLSRHMTRRVHLPLSVPEPLAEYSRRLANRAFLYATALNAYAAIGITASTCFYCQADSV